MAVYLVASIVSTVFSGLSSRAGAFWVRFAVGAVAVLPLAIVAGVRDVSIGHDTALYPLRVFDASLVMSLPGTMASAGDTVEPLYVVLVWVLTKLFGNFAVVLFASQYLVLLVIVYALVKLAPTQLPAGIFVYSWTTYLLSFDLMRQYMAYALVVLAYLSMRANRNLRSLGILGIAATLHATAVLGIVMFPLAKLTESVDESARLRDIRMTKRFVVWAVSIGCLVVALWYGEALVWLIAGAKSTFVYQTDNLGNGGFNATFTALVAFGIVPFVLIRGEGQVEGQRLEDLRLLMSIGLVSGALGTFSVISPALLRIGVGFTLFLPVYYGVCFESLKDLASRLLLRLVLYAGCFAYGLFNFIFSVNTAVYPYSSSILGI